MKILRGLLDGMVMQRGADGCDIRFTAESRGTVSASMGRVEALGGGGFRLTGVPVGGPYRLVLSDDGGEAVVDGVYVGDVWLLAGQSNMEGAGLRREKEIEYDKNPRPDVRAYYLDDRWDAARSLLHQQWLNTDPGVREKYVKDNERHLAFYGAFRLETASGVGPGHFIGLRMRELTGVPQGLIPCAYGGSGMCDWTPDNTTPASLYRSMLRRFEDCGAHVRGIFWYQGEGETSPQGVEGFNANMERFITALRADTGDPALPFVQAQIGPCSLPQAANPKASEGWHRIKELERLMPEWLPNTATVSNALSSLQDQIHIDARSQEELGGWMAEEMNRLITGEGEPMPALAGIEVFPHPVKLNYYLVALSFDHVSGSLTSVGRPYGFSVTVGDEKPYEYPCRYITSVCLEGRRALLAVERDYVPAERAFVWHGAGFSSVSTITDGAGRPLPVFGPVKVVR